MSIETRPATADDAPFLAWVMQEAARSHLENGIWDFAFPGEDEPRLEILAKIITTERIHFAHFSRFRVLAIDGEPASALAAYENSQHGLEQLTLGMAEAFSQLGWSLEEMLAVQERSASFAATGYPNPDGLWIVEWVATRPEFRGRALIRRLLLEILDLGREVEEHRHPSFEEDYGTPGIARMQRDL
jgi:GNAT superfamily N-acetyltransferase